MCSTVAAPEIAVALTRLLPRLKLLQELRGLFVVRVELDRFLGAGDRPFLVSLSSLDPTEQVVAVGGGGILLDVELHDRDRRGVVVLFVPQPFPHLLQGARS